MTASLIDTLHRLCAELSVDDSLSLIWAATSVLATILVERLAMQWYDHKLEKRAQAENTPPPAGPPEPGQIAPDIPAPRRITFKERAFRRGLPLLAPLLNLPILFAGVLLLDKMHYDPTLLDELKPMAFSWLFATLIYVVTGSMGKTIFVAILLIPPSMPIVRPYVHDMAKALSDFSFTVGKTELSALLLVRLIVTGVLLLWLATAAKNAVNASLGRLPGIRWSTRQLLQNLSAILIYIVAGLMLLSALGIDLTAFAVFGGAIGVGLGLGLQKIASNFISGMILLTEQSIQVNDMIEIAGSGITGMVRHTGARYTLVETPDNREMMIPNDDLITNRVINWTYTNTRGVMVIDVGVGYDSDLDLVREQLLEAARAHPDTMNDPAPACLLKQFGASSVDFMLIVHLEDIRNRRMAVKSDILLDIWRRFKKHDIDIPYPQVTVHYADQPPAPQDDR